MIPAGVRIFVCTERVDMRKSFDGLVGAAREKLGQDPGQGGLFVFANRRSNLLKVLWVERNGICLLCKRLSRALFRLPPRAGAEVGVTVDGIEFARILEGVPSLPRSTAAA